MARSPRRYLLVGIAADGPVSQTGFEKTVHEMLKDTFGQQGIADTSPRLIRYEEKKNQAILRCSRGSVDKLRAGLALITQVDGIPSAAWTIALAGSIRGLRRDSTSD